MGFEVGDLSLNSVSAAHQGKPLNLLEPINEVRTLIAHILKKKQKQNPVKIN